MCSCNLPGQRILCHVILSFKKGTEAVGLEGIALAWLLRFVIRVSGREEWS